MLIYYVFSCAFCTHFISLSTLQFNALIDLNISAVSWQQVITLPAVFTHPERVAQF